MMQIEFIGCTSAGKSTLTKGILQAAREQAAGAFMGDEFVLKQVRLNGVKGRLARTLCVDLLSLFACLVTWRENLEFYRLTMQIIWRLPAAVPWFEKLNIARNVLKNVGVYETIRRRGSDQQIVLVDEGTLHTAHYLFVHVSVEPSAGDLSTFAKLVPLPDVAIYVQQDEAVLIERTLARGHKRIPDGSYAQVKRFVERAADTFDELMRQLLLDSRLLVVAGEQDLVIAQDYRNEPLPAVILRIIDAGRDAALADDAAGAMPDSGFQDAQPASNMLL